MSYQNIDASLSPTDIKAIKAAFDTVLQKMPFLINLTPKERKSAYSRRIPIASPLSRMP
uniref:Uncharacterized protein n=1 Tax=Candidatus Kentrum sp. LPFa TaxID=2126335 RepID=A0A450WTU9_9GAMM|nr:MAG: hypothetical protein BECKLPF1236B_GA0070989_12124 [Candidatus Kentron sp. LPFa]